MSLVWLLCGLVRLAAFCRELDPVEGDAVPTESDQGSERLSAEPGRSRNLPDVRPAAARAAAQVGLARLPRLFTSAHTPTPVTFGLFWPAVVLPEGLADHLPPDQLDAVLVHEMAHVVRPDPWVGLLQRLAAALYWWCPLVQRLNRRLAEVREEVCDNCVLSSQDDGASLAEVLVALAERLASPAPLPATVSMLVLSLFPVRESFLERLRDLPQLQELVLKRTHVDDAGLEPIQRLPQLQALSLIDNPVTDAGLVVLQGLPQLRRLTLQQTRVTNAGLKHLRGLTQLQQLNLLLFPAPITDAGLADIGNLTSLRELELPSPVVSDAGLERLSRLTQLAKLNLQGTRVSGAGLAQGGTFHFTLPLQVVPQPAVPRPVADASCLGRVAVLVVDDNAGF